jgi:hypothetical protein
MEDLRSEGIWFKPDGPRNMMQTRNWLNNYFTTTTQNIQSKIFKDKKPKTKEIPLHNSYFLLQNTKGLG